MDEISRRKWCCGLRFLLVVVAMALPNMTTPAAVASQWSQCTPFEPVYEAYYSEFSAQEYQQLLPSPRERDRYWTRHMLVGNPFQEGDQQYEIAFITLQEPGGHVGSIAKAYLVLCVREGRQLREHRVIELYDGSKRSRYRTSAEFRIAPQYISAIVGHEPMVEDQPLSIWSGFEPRHGDVEFTDFSGDGRPEIVLRVRESANRPLYLVRVFDYVEGVARPLLTAFCSGGTGGPEVRDADTDGSCELTLPQSVYAEFAGAEWPSAWITTYEWDGERFSLDNGATYRTDIALLDHDLDMHQRLSERVPDYYLEAYEFQIGMIYYYKDDHERATHFLERVAEKGENEEYITVARAVLDELRSQSAEE